MKTTSNSRLESLALTLFDIGAVRLGQFKLHSGRISPIYLDLRLLVSYPEALRQVTAVYRTLLETMTFDLLAAEPLGGLPIGTALCLDMDVPLVYHRKTVKGYGTGKRVEGKWEAGQTAVVVDDLITSGDSILGAIAAFKAAGLQVSDAVVLIDREQGGVEAVQAEGYNLHAAVTLNHLLTILEERERITAEQRTQVLESLK